MNVRMTGVMATRTELPIPASGDVACVMVAGFRVGLSVLTWRACSAPLWRRSVRSALSGVEPEGGRAARRPCISAKCFANS